MKEAVDFVEPRAANFEESVALVQKYEDLLKKGIRARKQIVRELPVNDRVNIWKVQLAFHLATGKFSEAQRKFILDFLINISPATFAPRNLSIENEIKVAEELDRKIQTLFSKAESFAILRQLEFRE